MSGDETPQELHEVGPQYLKNEVGASGMVLHALASTLAAARTRVGVVDFLRTAFCGRPYCTRSRLLSYAWASSTGLWAFRSQHFKPTRAPFGHSVAPSKCFAKRPSKHWAFVSAVHSSSRQAGPVLALISLAGTGAMLGVSFLSFRPASRLRSRRTRLTLRYRFQSLPRRIGLGFVGKSPPVGSRAEHRRPCPSAHACLR